jgi:prevent-host-death family protein
MKTIPVGTFKAECLGLIDYVQAHGGEIVITRRGKPLAKLVPMQNTKTQSILGFMKGRAKIVGDITEPIMTDQDVARRERQLDKLNKSSRIHRAGVVRTLW